jgi:hypothetical protein
MPTNGGKGADVSDEQSFQHADIDQGKMVTLKPLFKILFNAIPEYLGKFKRGDDNPWLQRKIRNYLSTPKPDTIDRDLGPLVHVFPVYVMALVARYLALDDPNTTPLEFLSNWRRRINSHWFEQEHARLRTAWIPQHLDMQDCKLQNTVVTNCAEYMLHAMHEIDKIFIACAMTSFEEETEEVVFETERVFRRNVEGTARQVARTRLMNAEDEMTEPEIITFMLNDHQSDVAKFGNAESRNTAALFVAASDDNYNAEDARTFANMNYDRITELEHVVRLQSTQLALLLNDIPPLLASTGKNKAKGGRNNKAVWYEECNAVTRAVKDNDALVFGTNGQKMSKDQVKGKKQKDAVIDRYSHLLHAEDAKWGQFDEVCTRVC